MFRTILIFWFGIFNAANLTSSLVAQAPTQDELRVLFIGNSFTGRHNLAQVVQSMAAAGEPSVQLNVTTVIYGGRRLVDHWRLGTQNFVNLHRLTADDVATSIESLQAGLKQNPDDQYAKGAIGRQTSLLKELDMPHPKWDVVVLQSYRDDLEGDESLYMQYAPKFAQLAAEQKARVILYETTPTTQNAEALTQAPGSLAILAKAQSIARLANRVDASVAPMSLVAWRCQSERPDITLRFVNDGHLNQAMAYLTACTIYAAMFERTPQGLPIDSITDTRFFSDTEKQKDRDGNPITRVFSPGDRDALQRIAWDGFREFEQLRKEEL